MKAVIFAFALMGLIAGLSVAQDYPGFRSYPNEIGLFTTSSPTSVDDAYWPDVGGRIPLYLVISNPWNTNRDQLIYNLGGFECRLVLPAGWSILGDIQLPPDTVNFRSFPEFYVGGTIPTANVGEHTVLAQFEVGSFGAPPGFIMMTPISSPTLPGSIAVFDADWDFEPCEAFPVSGDFEAPIFGFGLQVVETEPVSWGGVKALYQ